ncbi:cytochrome c oxidase subunit II [Pendulispora brunnea]|uniref:Cytochrome c oxidase subunit 2 n=1 Tax=Pendulispora brunnea TaxID=2905690 RepID=A0ABZ2KHC9_9BACT
MVSPDNFQLPEQLSTGAAEVDDLYMFVYWFSLIFTAIIVAVMIYCIVKFRRRPGVKAEPVGHNLVLELVWTFAPVVFIAILFHLGFKVYVHNAVAQEGAMEIRVRGRQWLWEFQYPNGSTATNELKLPVGKPVKFIISSDDVLHSFYVPGARLKRDAVPGMYTNITFTPNKLGPMQVFCAEYCGTSHSGMLSMIEVMTPEAFQKFLDEGDKPPAGTSPEEYGATLYKKNACNTCHSVDGAKMPGPTWKGLWGKQEQMADGSTVTVDENYIKESILKPQAKITAGFTTTQMPPFTLKDPQIDAIIAYMKTLK